MILFSGAWSRHILSLRHRYLNQVPHNRYVRQWFYDQAATAIHDAVVLTSRGHLTNRMQVVTLFPETNPSMDSYRIGTLLELVRAVALRLAVEEQLRVRICVQGSMGVGIFTGIPKQLTGVARLLPAMDWQSGPGELHEGVVGEYVRFGTVGPDQVVNTMRDTVNDTVITQYQDDVFLVLAPQSMVGTDTSIIPLLSGMVEAAGDRPVILFNADLTDKISAAGQQSVRGRQARIDFANSFTTVFHFQNIYVSGTSYFPILGSITKLHPDEPWVACQRRDYANDGGEVYVPGTWVLLTAFLAF
jgi:adenylate kinase